MSDIQIADGLTFPSNAVTQAFGFIARRGGGKSYAAGRLVEELHRIGAPVIVLDPVGTWYGLRLAANGKSPGLPIPVFGGEHGDVSITEHQGERVGTLLIERDLSAVVDVSAFSKGAMKRFVADFAEALFQAAKRNRAARMVVLEEAQLFAPQQSSGQERMLGAMESIVRLGRNYGLGSVMISQRPQSVNKEVLNQVEGLFVGQLTGPQERKTIEVWVGERAAGAKEAVKMLPELDIGEMLFWSPQWLKTFQKVSILKKWTYDASSTPELGKATRRVQTLAEVDVAGLRAALEDEPKPARAGANGSTHQPISDQHLADLAESADTIAELREDLAAALDSLKLAEEREALLRDNVPTLRERGQQLASMADSIDDILGEPLAMPRLRPTPQEATSSARPTPAPRPQPRASSPTATDVPGLKSGARRMLGVLAAFAPLTLTRHQIGFAARVSASGGTFGDYWSKLKSLGYLEESDGRATITKAGVLVAGKPAPELCTYKGRADYFRPLLKAGARRMLDAALAAPASGLSREELGRIAVVDSEGGTFGDYLSVLRNNELVVAERTGPVRVHRWLRNGSAHA